MGICEATHCNQVAELACGHCEKDYCFQHATESEELDEIRCCYCGDDKKANGEED